MIKADDPVCFVCDRVIMRDHDEGRPLSVQVAEERHHRLLIIRGQGPRAGPLMRIAHHLCVSQPGAAFAAGVVPVFRFGVRCQVVGVRRVCAAMSGILLFPLTTVTSSLPPMAPAY